MDTITIPIAEYNLLLKTQEKFLNIKKECGEVEEEINENFIEEILSIDKKGDFLSKNDSLELLNSLKLKSKNV